MPKKIENMNVQELETRNRELMADKEKIREEQRAIGDAMAAAQARERVDQMPDAEREALKQALDGAGGIDASES